MTAAEQEWQPGDPLMPDNGCGTVPPITWSTEERRAAVNEGERTPPWYRPHESIGSPGFNRHCKPCGVQWRGDDPCWMCGGEQLP
jgi:hypothetical protein